MKKKFLLIFMLFVLSVSLFSCKKEKTPFLIVSGDGKISLFDKNLNLIKDFKTEFKGKIILGEIRKDLVLFNYFSDDYTKSGIYCLNFESGEIFNLTDGLLGYFPYTPKFYDDENIIFTLKESGGREYLYIYNLKIKNKKPLIMNLISQFIQPIYIDELNNKIYIHILKYNEANSKIGIYNFITEEFVENYITFDNKKFYFRGIQSENGEILGTSYDNITGKEKIEILNLDTKEYKLIYEESTGDISDETFVKNSQNILFKLTPNELGKKGYIVLIDRNGKVLKTIDGPTQFEFYVREVLGNYLYLMAQEEVGGKYFLYTSDLEKISYKKLTRETYFYGGDFIFSNSFNKIIISEIKEGTLDKDYILMDLNGENKVNLNEKLKIKIDSILFYKKWDMI